MLDKSQYICYNFIEYVVVIEYETVIYYIEQEGDKINERILWRHKTAKYERH